MIRQPSTMAQLYGWHRAAVNGENPPRHDGIPHCGWFKRRLVKSGPWVPVRIFVDRDIDLSTGELTCDEVLRIEVEGVEDGDPAEHWTYLTPITREEFGKLTEFCASRNNYFEGWGDVKFTYLRSQIATGYPWFSEQIITYQCRVSETDHLIDCQHQFVSDHQQVVTLPDVSSRFEITREEFNHLTDYRLRDSARMLDTRRPIDLSAAPTLPQGAF